MVNLYIVCGPSGSGKTTWIKNRLTDKDAYISRDKIRFSYLYMNVGSQYFSFEKKVFNEFVEMIQYSIDDGFENIYADATHLNEISRNKLLDRLNLKNVSIRIVNFHVDYDTCMKNNDKRVGVEHVPVIVIKNQFKDYVPATVNEKYVYTEIIDV